VTVLFRRVAAIALVLVCSGVLSLSAVFAQAQPQKPPDEGFLPLDQLPPTEQFPAARLLIAAYIVVVVVLFLYLLSVARRLNTVQREVDRLEADVKRTGRA
jgi:CcmD family protein